MINLAIKDIEHSFSKFIVTAISVGILLGIVIIMIGVYRGMVFDAKEFVKDLNVNIWVVQQDTLGPFAETSKIHEDLKNQISYQEGIKAAEAITFQNMQLSNDYGDFKAMVVGYDPFGKISAINPQKLIAGRSLKKQHYEIVVDVKTHYKLGEKIKLGRDIYTVVGITKNTVSNSGDYLMFVSLKDAQILQFTYSNERIRRDEKRGISGGNPHLVNAIIARVKKGYNPQEIAKRIADNTNKSVYTTQDELKLLMYRVIKKSSKQIGTFTVILIIVSIVIIALIIYTMTLEKMKELSIMKLIGIPNSTIAKMIMQETMILSALAFIAGNIFAHMISGRFPKRIVLLWNDSFLLFAIIIVFSIFASFFGIYKVMKTDPTEAIGG